MSSAAQELRVSATAPSDRVRRFATSPISPEAFLPFPLGLTWTKHGVCRSKNVQFVTGCDSKIPVYAVSHPTPQTVNPTCFDSIPIAVLNHPRFSPINF